MSNEVILNLSFDNQTVTDLTGNWTLDGTPNVTYEQISGGSGYSLVTGTLGTPPTLVAVDQEAIYNEYTIDFNLYAKPNYTDTGWFSFFNLNTGLHYEGDYKAEIDNGLTIHLEVGSSTSAMVTIDLPTNRWIHITIISEYDSDTGAYTAYLYVDSVLRTYRQGIRLNGSPFAIGKKLVLFNRGGSSFYLPNTPGLAMDGLTVIEGIHAPNQKPAISLLNLSRVFNNFCTWLKRQLSTVAFTGSYNDLSNKPTISTVNDGTLTIQQNGTNVQTFTANASTNKTANIQCVDLSTAQTIGGVKTFTSNMVIQGSKKVTCNLDNSFIELDGGTTWGKGGSIVLSGQDRSSYTNSVLIVSKSDTNTDILQYQNGELKPHQNNTNNPSLGTSTNKWSKVYSDDVVHTTGDETISGVKTFSDIPIVVNGKSYVSKINANRTDGTQTGFSAYNGFKIVCNNDSQGWDNTAFAIHIPEYSPTRAAVGFKLYDCIEGSSSYKGFGFNKNNNDFYLYPTATNIINLGSSASQWKNTYTRNILIDNDINIASSLINKTSNSGVLTMRGGISDTEGASLSLYGKDYSGSPGLIGNIYMTAYGSSDYTNFRIYPNGIIRVYNNSTATTKNVAMQEDVVPRSGGAVLTDYFLGRSVDTGSLMISGGTSWSSGGSLEAFGSSHSSYAGRVRLQPALSDSNFKTMNLEPSGTWTWSGTACQITSDQRFKQQISNIDDKLLDAWEDVDLVQFKYNDAVEEKSDNARLHTGYVVQQIDDACKSHGVDVSKYGLYCYEEYAEETREVEHEDGTKTTEVVKPASEHYSLRYTEALIVECAYLRKCIKELRTEIEQLKSSK